MADRSPDSWLDSPRQLIGSTHLDCVLCRQCRHLETVIRQRNWPLIGRYAHLHDGTGYSLVALLEYSSIAVLYTRRVESFIGPTGRQSPFTCRCFPRRCTVALSPSLTRWPTSTLMHHLLLPVHGKSHYQSALNRVILIVPTFVRSALSSTW